MGGVHSRWWVEDYDVKARRNRDAAVVCVARINPEIDLNHDEEIVLARAVAAVPKMVAALRLVKAACGDAKNWNGETRAFIEATDAALADVEGRT